MNLAMQNMHFDDGVWTTSIDTPVEIRRRTTKNKLPQPKWQRRGGVAVGGSGFFSKLKFDPLTRPPPTHPSVRLTITHHSPPGSVLAWMDGGMDGWMEGGREWMPWHTARVHARTHARMSACVSS